MKGSGCRAGYGNEKQLYEVLSQVLTTPSSLLYTNKRELSGMQKDILLNEKYQEFFREVKKLDDTWSFKPMT